MGLSKADASVIALTVFGGFALVWGMFGLMSAANGNQDASPFVGVVFVLIGVAVITGAWLSWRNERRN